MCEILEEPSYFDGKEPEAHATRFVPLLQCLAEI